jgi:hypothetical protein
MVGVCDDGAGGAGGGAGGHVQRAERDKHDVGCGCVFRYTRPWGRISLGAYEVQHLVSLRASMPLICLATSVLCTVQRGTEAWCGGN